ncbi:hypothetical protein N0V82_005494 [Gnomoniopsis sp. IMI 355080]|nr:hypothetical protein N0V82_005494 [Gnomoniopsis sp. IMI 355080]
MLLSLILVSILVQVGISNPLPQAESASCSTTTLEVIIPTTTATYTTTPISTIYATTADDLGTFTNIVRIPSTSTVATVVSTATACVGNDTVATRALATQYTTAGAASLAPAKRDVLVADQQDAAAAQCVVTTTFTTSVGQTYVFVPGTSTKLYTQYTAFSQATVTMTTYSGTTYVVASETAAVTPGAEACATAILDSRCNPSAMVSAAGGTNNTQYGLVSKSDVPTSGAKYSTTTSDASSCCQMCAEMDDVCSGSAWDVRTGACFLEFAVNPVDGELNCGESLLAYYDAGPLSPMEPGAGWWVANICGSAEYGSAGPDDGS